jgi:O-antigen/teichoic acid export membrane protein
MSIKKLSVNSLVYALGPQLPKIVSLLMLPIITPHLSARDYGVFGTLMAYAAAITALKDLGLTSVLSVSFYKYPNRYKFIWNKLFALSTVWAIPLSFILALVIYLVLPKAESQYYLMIVLLNCLPLILFEPTKWLGRKYFQLIQKPIPIVTFNGIAALGGVVSNYITIVIFKMGYLGWFISSFVISFISFLPYLWIIVKSIKLRFDFNMNQKWLKRYLAIGLPVLPHFYSIYLLDASDRLILNWYQVPFDEIGLYSLAYTLGGYFAIVGNALGEASGPMYMKLFRSETIGDEVKAKNLTFVMQGGTLLLAFLVALWMKEAFGMLIRNEALKSGYVITLIIIMSYSYRPIYFGPINKLQYMLKTKELWKISFVAGLLNVVLNLILVPFYGIWGSVLATFIAMMFMGFRGYLLKSFRDNNPVKYYPLFWFLAICISTFLVYFIRDVHFIYKAILTLMILSSAAYYYYKNKFKLAF